MDVLVCCCFYQHGNLVGKFPSLGISFISTFTFFIDELLESFSGFVCIFSTVFGKDTFGSFLGSFS